MYLSEPDRRVVPTRGVLAVGLLLSFVWSSAAFAVASFDAEASVAVQLTANPGGLDVAIFNTPLADANDAFGDATSGADANATPTVDEGAGDLPVTLSVGGTLSLDAMAQATARSAAALPFSWGTGTATASGVVAIDNPGGNQTLSFDLNWAWATALQQQTVDEWATVGVLLDVLVANADPAANPNDPANTLLSQRIFQQSFDTRTGGSGDRRNGVFQINALLVPNGTWVMLVDLTIQNGEAQSSFSAAAPLPAPVALMLPALAFLARGRRGADDGPRQGRERSSKRAGTPVSSSMIEATENLRLH